MNRRKFLKTSAVLGLGCSLLPVGCWFDQKSISRKKMLVLGIDGMDAHLARQYMHRGLLPNFSRLAKKGSMHSAASSVPPQSPVAWSDFAVGASSTVHGIYDFIHRDPHTMIPYLSTSSVVPPLKTIDFAGYKIPLSKGSVENLRKGIPFWDHLAERDIPTTIFKAPANFPCQSENVDMVSGMGTPDLRGGYGSFTLFTTAPQIFRSEMTGGKVIKISFQGQKAHAELPGPSNTFEQGSPAAKIPLQIWRDKNRHIVRIVIQDKEFLLQEREWTGWFQLSFPMLEPLFDVKGICKIYIKDVHPDFTMYASPINIDPSDPALPVVTSKRYAEELVKNVGYFYTQGLPADTKALSEGVFSEKEYLDLSAQIILERKKLLDYELNRFSRQNTGLLFFYISSLDQDSHMYWRTIDPYNPLYDKGLNQKYGHTIKSLYVEMDQILGAILDQNDMNDPNLTLMVMSDHGFAPFRRQVNLNTWLFENEYLYLSDPKNIENKGYFENVKWSQTGAYGLGINAIYLNIRGREKYGILSQSQARELRGKIQRDLLNLVDTETGNKAVSNVWIVPESDRRRNPHAPDMIVGWNIGYRTSWDSILGSFSRNVISDNRDKWSGDHCIDPSLVPAVLFSNKKVTKENPSVRDIPATILKEFGIVPDGQMQGKPLYRVS